MINSFKLWENMESEIGIFIEKMKDSLNSAFSYKIESSDKQLKNGTLSIVVFNNLEFVKETFKEFNIEETDFKSNDHYDTLMKFLDEKHLTFNIYSKSGKIVIRYEQPREVKFDSLDDDSISKCTEFIKNYCRKVFVNCATHRLKTSKFSISKVSSFDLDVLKNFLETNCFLSVEKIKHIEPARFQVLYPYLAFLCFISMNNNQEYQDLVEDYNTSNKSDVENFKVYDQKNKSHFSILTNDSWKVDTTNNNLICNIRYRFQYESSDGIRRDSLYDSVKDIVKNSSVPEYYIKAFDFLKKPNGFEKLQNGDLRGAIHGHTFGI